MGIELPTIECQGLCHDQCTWIPMTKAEYKRVVEAGGERSQDMFECGYLNYNKRCDVYEVRPLICRLYGVTENMQCPHGCKPSRLLSQSEASELIRQNARVGNQGG